MIVAALACGDSGRAEEIIGKARGEKAYRLEDAGKASGWITNMKNRIQAVNISN
jgi:hypothetical protein